MVYVMIGEGRMHQKMTHSLAIALLLVISASCWAESWSGESADILITVRHDGVPLHDAAVALDMNNNGLVDGQLAELFGRTDGNGVVRFDGVTVQQDRGDDRSAASLVPGGARILTGNLRGQMDARNVRFEFALPAGLSAAELALFDLRGRRLARLRGTGDLTLDVPSGLPSGVYFVRLSSGSLPAVSQRITSVGTRTRSIMARRVSAAEATEAGWYKSATATSEKTGPDESRDITLLVSHEQYGCANRTVPLVRGFNQFDVHIPVSPEGFVHVSPGRFLMGSPEDEPGRESNEGPRHPVTLTRGFFMAKHEVTEEWWHEVMGGLPSTSKLPQSVTWDEAVRFCNELSSREGLTPAYVIGGPDGAVTWNQDASGYRLPTEAEWEYASRAGSQDAFAAGTITNTSCQDPVLNDTAWYCGTRTLEEGPAPVGLKQRNAWGLHDMHGNLWEWVWCGWRTYTASPQLDPVTSPGVGSYRVSRGGHWFGSARHCRSAVRTLHAPGAEEGTRILGFRPVRPAFCPQESAGSIVIDPGPGCMVASWQLDGPCGFQSEGAGKATLSIMDPGSYMVTWADVAGWVTPSSVMRTLEANRVLEFKGVYVENGSVHALPGAMLYDSFDQSAYADSNGLDCAQWSILAVRGNEISDCHHIVSLFSPLYYSGMGPYHHTESPWGPFPGLMQALADIEDTGGLAFIAHPRRYHPGIDGWLPSLADSVAAITAWYKAIYDHSDAAVAMEIYNSGDRYSAYTDRSHRRNPFSTHRALWDQINAARSYDDLVWGLSNSDYHGTTYGSPWYAPGRDPSGYRNSNHHFMPALSGAAFRENLMSGAFTATYCPDIPQSGSMESTARQLTGVQVDAMAGTITITYQPGNSAFTEWYGSTGLVDTVMTINGRQRRYRHSAPILRTPATGPSSSIDLNDVGGAPYAGNFVRARIVAQGSGGAYTYTQPFGIRRNGDRWIISNPYQDVVWSGGEAWQSYRSNLHTHTRESDGQAFPHEIMEYYAYTTESGYPYDVLSITDHDRVVWPWSAYSQP